jgi:hypothetical protein
MTLDQIINQLSGSTEMKVGVDSHMRGCGPCQRFWNLPHYYQVVEMGGPRRFGGPDPAVRVETADISLVHKTLDMMRDEDLAYRQQTGWPKFVGLSILGWYDV